MDHSHFRTTEKKRLFVRNAPYVRQPFMKAALSRLITT